MKTIQWISLLCLAMLSAAWVRAGEEIAHNATVVSVEGSATIQLSGESSSKPIKVGTVVPVGSSIRTNPGAQVAVKLFDSTVAIIKSNSSVNVEKLSVTTDGSTITKETALLNLRIGNIITSLDPAKHGINDYGVRTPKGVAAARGTVFAVGVNTDQSSSVATMSGTVVFYTDSGVISIPLGNFASVPAGSNKTNTLSDLIASNPALANELLSSIKAINDQIAAGTIPNTPGLATALSSAATVIAPTLPNPVTVTDPATVPTKGSTTTDPILPPINTQSIIVSPAAP